MAELKVLIQGADWKKEKHVPVMDKTSTGVMVKVGSVPHPMEDKHYIEWVELITTDGRAYRQSNPRRFWTCVNHGWQTYRSR
jgi:superoxide reductase